MNRDCCIDELEAIIKRLVRFTQLFERDQIAKFGLTSAQYYTMLEIWRQPGITMNELSDRLFISISTASRVVDKLVKAELIQRERASDDRRVVRLVLTEEGIKRVSEVQESVSDYYRNIIINVPQGQLEPVLNSTRFLMKAFEEANPHCC